VGVVTLNRQKRYLFFISQDYSFPILRPLQSAIAQRGDEVKWFLYGDEMTPSLLYEEESLLLNVEEIIDYQPDAVFVPGNVVPSFIPGLKVQVFHGLPSTKKKKNGELYHFIIRGMFDLYCTQGPSSTHTFQALAQKHGYFDVVETGWCKLDPLFPLQKSVKPLQHTILFASTFSPRFSKAKFLYPYIQELIKKYDFQWYITLHPKMDSETVKRYKSLEGSKVTFVEQDALIQAFKVSDVMLCDTSSIIYEFLVQRKPVITFQTLKEESHLINVTDVNALEETLLQTLQNPKEHRSVIEQSVQAFHPYSDGKSSRRVLEAVDKMLEGKNRRKKKKPWNLLRNYKLRKELNYWNFF
jgi:CDP-glycerol glycerophosphotransferase (TagB/SpsB family)